MPRNLLWNQEKWNRHVHHFPSYVEQSWLPLDEVLASKMTEDWYSSWDSSSFPDLTIPRRFLALGARIHLATSILMECWAWVCRPWHWVTLTMLHPRDEMGRETDELISVQNLLNALSTTSPVFADACFACFAMVCWLFVWSFNCFCQALNLASSGKCWCKIHRWNLASLHHRRFTCQTKRYSDF